MKELAYAYVYLEKIDLFHKMLSKPQIDISVESQNEMIAYHVYDHLHNILKSTLPQQLILSS